MISNKNNKEYSRLEIARLLKKHRKHVKAFWKELEKNELTDIARHHSKQIAYLEDKYTTIYFQEV